LYIYYTNFATHLGKFNRYVQVLKNAGDIIHSGVVVDMCFQILRSRLGGQYTGCAVDEVADLVVGGEDAEEIAVVK